MSYNLDIEPSQKITDAFFEGIKRQPIREPFQKEMPITRDIFSELGIDKVVN